MDKQSIQKILQQNYSRALWNDLLLALFPNTKYFTSPKNITTDNHSIEKILQLGTIELNDFKRIGVFEVLVSSQTNIPRNRIALRSSITPFIDQDKFHGALVIFFQQNISEYRFSFIAKVSEFDEEGALNKIETHPKRYTYVFGPNQSCRTATDRFYSLISEKGIFTELKDLLAAFSVDKLTKEFFDEYYLHYQAFVRFLIFSKYLKTVFKISSKESLTISSEETKPVREFVKMLLGRIVFIYFLQKKGWMGCPANNEEWKDGDPNFLSNFFKSFSIKENFYSTGLSILFFHTLNTKRTNDIFELTNTRVPYLNGGLFENDFEAGNSIDFDPKLFTELFEFFDRYNFTIDESAPYDHEVGIDPEMLGHIFENLLEDNKDKGSYYTPKDVVHYMCQQSLLRFLKNKLISDNLTDKKEAEEALEKFVLFKDKGVESSRNNFIKLNAKKIEEIVDNIKICDPAIGSGAFPMGLLKELYEIKTSLDWTLPSTETKKKIIQNSIYGVDIDKGAVDIARLRFWLSLVVDEDIPAPLPNFDYKIMQGDSLRESFKGIDFHFNYKRLLSKQEVQKDTNLFGEVNDAQYSLDEYLASEASKGRFNIIEKENILFNSVNHEEKDIIRNEISEIEKTFIRAKIENEKSQTRSQLIELEAKLKREQKTSKIKNLRKFIEYYKERLEFLVATETEIENLENDNKPYFLWQLYFIDVFKNGGFDIFIANPPYIRADSKNPAYKSFRKEIEESNMYSTLYEKWDIFIPFIERGLNFLKEDGVLVYITSNALCTSKYAEHLLDYIQSHHSTFILDYFEKMFVFEGVGVIPVISGFVKGIKNDIKVIQTIRSKIFDNIIEQSIIPINEFREGNRNSFRKEFDPISIGVNFEFLNNICYISKGMVINADEKKYKDEFKKDDLISDEYNEVNNKNYLEAKWIKRYYIENNKFLEWGTDRVPFKLSRPTFPELYDRPKIMRGATIGGIYDENKFVSNHSILIFMKYELLAKVDNRSISNSISKFNALPRYELERISEKFEYKYLLAIINSKFAYYFLNNIRRHRLENYFYPDDFRKLPIPIVSKEIQDTISVLVDYITFLKKVDDGSADMNLMISYIDQIIDGCVYELFFPDKFEKKNWHIIKDISNLQNIDENNSREVNIKMITKYFKELYNPEGSVRKIIAYLNTIEEINKIEKQYANYRN